MRDSSASIVSAVLATRSVSGGVLPQRVELKPQRRQRIADLVGEDGGGQPALGQQPLPRQLRPLADAADSSPRAVGVDRDRASTSDRRRRQPGDAGDQRPLLLPELVVQGLGRELQVGKARGPVALNPRHR